MGIAADSASASRERFMRVALQFAERGMAAGGPPVGACLVRDGEILASAHNAVIADIDPTAHAEMVALRAAASSTRSLTLPGSQLFVTVEPCAMCIAACFYAEVDEIIFGAPIDALQAVTEHELGVASETLLAGHSRPRVAGGLLEDECAALVTQWAKLRGVMS